MKHKVKVNELNVQECLICITILILFMTLSAIPCSAKSTTKFATITADDPFLVPDMATAVVFKNMVETGTNGEIEVKIYPNAVLGKERQCMEMVRSGVIHFFLAATGSLAPFMPEIGVLTTPFLIPNYSVAYDVFDGWFGEKLKELVMEKTGLRVLAITGYGGFFNFTNNKRRIRTVEDMKGIKFRTMTMPSHIAFFRSMDASAVPISWAEIYTSLQTGVVDGQHNQPSIIVSGKLYEVQKYLTMTRHIFDIGFLVVNENWFQSLSPACKNVLIDAGRVAKVASRGVNTIWLSTDKGLPFLAKHMDVYTPTPEERQTFADVTIPAMRKWVREEIGDKGAALQEDYIKAVNESIKKLGY